MKDWSRWPFSDVRCAIHEASRTFYHILGTLVRRAKCNEGRGDMVVFNSDSLRLK